MTDPRFPTEWRPRLASAVADAYGEPQEAWHDEAADRILERLAPLLAERERMVIDALRAIRFHGEEDEYPCHAIADADCIDTMRELAGAALAALEASPAPSEDGSER